MRTLLVVPSAVCWLFLAACGREAPPEFSQGVAGSEPIVPDDDPAAVARFESMLEQGANTQLIEELGAYLEKYPNSYKGQHLLGWAFARSDRLDEALAAFERSTVLNPKWDNAYVGQGVVWRKRGELDKAVAAYQKAIEVNPRAAEAYSSLATIELMRGNYEKAHEFGAQAWELSNKRDATIAANFAIACHYAKDESKRDEMVAAARQLGYAKMTQLDGIVSGELNPF